MKEMFLKIIARFVFAYCKYKLNITGELKCINDPAEAWFAKHCESVVTLNMAKVNSVNLVRSKIRHESWHLVQLKKDRTKLLWLERTQQDFPVEGNAWMTYYRVAPHELEALYFELFAKTPPPFFDSLKLDSLVFFHRVGHLIAAMQLSAYRTLEERGELHVAKQLKLPLL